MVICKYFQQGCCKYGQNCRFEHVFGSKYTYSRAPPQQQNTPNQNNVFNQASGSASSLFRSAVQSNAPSVFGQNPANRPSVFSRLGHQPQYQHSNTNDSQARSLFAQATQNVFGQANAQRPVQVPNQNPFTPNPKSVFAQANQNVFQQQRHIPPQQNNAANLFASAAQNVFAQSTPMQSAPPPNVFHISKPTNVFNGANNSFDLCDDSLYSNLEELSKTDIEAFESADFKLGCIPEVPPPRTLCT